MALKKPKIFLVNIEQLKENKTAICCKTKKKKKLHYVFGQIDLEVSKMYLYFFILK